MRVIIICLTVASLVGCSADSTLADGLASHDVPCLQRQVFELGSSFTDAVATCGVRKPDLTGSGELQQAALQAQVPFTIRPHADHYLKEAQSKTVTGSNIPGVGAGAGFTVLNGAVQKTVLLGDGH